jgi:hypothetical protein
MQKKKFLEAKHSQLTQFKHQHNKDPEWFKHEKHVFVLTWSGRPVFTRYGDDTMLAAYMGVISAHVSNFERLGDECRSIVAGRTTFVFQLKGPLYFVCVSKTGESVQQLASMLSHVHALIISVLTAGVNEMLEAQPQYDVRNLLGGTNTLLNDVIERCDSEPNYLLQTTSCLTLLAKGMRAKIQAIMNKNRCESAAFSIMLAGNEVIALLSGGKRTLSVQDLLLLIQVTGSVSVRQEESWTPICLPQFNDGGHLFAYVYTVPKSEISFIFLTTSPGAFNELRDYRDDIHQKMNEQGLIDELQSAVRYGLLSVEEMQLGASELVHFLFKNEATSQLHSCQHALPCQADEEQLTLFRNYQLVHAHMHRGIKPHAMYYYTTESATLMGMVKPGEYELYAAFSPLVRKVEAEAICHRLIKWHRKHEQALFVPWKIAT